MSISVHCARCGQELIEPGALLFGIPSPRSGNVTKLHLCRDCYEALMLVVNCDVPAFKRPA